MTTSSSQPSAIEGRVERLLDPESHDVGREADRLHAVGELVLDEIGHEPGQRILRHDADDVGELARRVQPGVAAHVHLGHAAEAQDLAELVAVGQVLWRGHRGISSYGSGAPGDTASVLLA
mgnify:CR=1 FL=1